MLIIPAIDLMGGKCVRLYQGDFSKSKVYGDSPLEQARQFEAAGFSRVHIVDLDGAREGSGVNRGAIFEVAGALRVPVQVGGGIRSEKDVAELLDGGVAHLIISTAALNEPDRVTAWVARWGASPFIVSLDLRGGKLQTGGWLDESRLSLEAMTERVRGWGLSQVICTDVERDGTLDQPNYPTYVRLRSLLPEPVMLLAAGGISRVEDIRKLGEAGVQGAVVGRAIYEQRISLEELAGAG
jgi:phosphoribosylformimino-5-aminoimidazole carboxamide ribotide isomerase